MPDVPVDAAACTLIAGDLEAVFLPARGMLGASLRHRGAQLLRRVSDLQMAAAKGSTAGIALLHPWANRLDGMRYRAAGREVTIRAILGRSSRVNVLLQSIMSPLSQTTANAECPAVPLLPCRLA